MVLVVITWKVHVVRKSASVRDGVTSGPATAKTTGGVVPKRWFHRAGMVAGACTPAGHVTKGG